MKKLILVSTLAAFGLVSVPAFSDPTPAATVTASELAAGTPVAGGEVIGGTFFTWAQLVSMGAISAAAAAAAAALVNNASDNGTTSTSTATSTN